MRTQAKECFGEIDDANGRDCSIWIAEEHDDNGARVRRLMLVTGNARVLMNEAQADEFIRTLRIARNELAKMNG